MTPIEFLRAVWPSEGYYCLAIPFTPKGSTKRIYRHKVCSSIAEAALAVRENAPHHDLFLCIHTLAEPKVWNPEKIDAKTGEPGAYEYRTQSNMRAARAFFFDLDVAPDSDRKYATQGEAAADLMRFCKATGLPKPLVTSSGGGLHVYWLVTDEIPSEEWRTHASKLRALARHHGLKADPARTTDTASVLRVVGTYNLKDRLNPRPVTALSPAKHHPTGAFLKQVDDAVIKAGVTVKPASPVFQHTELGSNLSEEYSGPPVAFKAVVAACAQMQRLVRLRGRVSEPEWYHSINLARFCENGEKYAHKISEGDPSYSKDETDRKLQQLREKGIKPTSCAKLAEVAGDELCEGCPFAGKVKSPIVAARYKDPAPRPILQQGVGPVVDDVEIPDPPKPFTRMKDGKIAMMVKNKEGDSEPSIIFDHDLYPIRRLVNASSESEQQMWRVVLPRSGQKDFTLDADALYDRKKFQVAISNHGLYPKTGNVPYLQEYMIAYISELQRLTDAEAQSNHLGWTDDQTRFILPDKIIARDGTAKAAMLSVGASRSSEHVRKKGTLEQQVELMKFYDHPAYVQNQFYILCGLAAPIFFATGHHGVVVNASGEPGASKSSSLYTAASFWGEPEMYSINGTNNGATVRGRNERVTTLANLPICVDEITHMAPKDAVDLAMSITQPGHRIRLNTEGVERKSSGSYKATIMLATANNSLHGLLSTENAAGTAGAMRVIEIVFKKCAVHMKADADDYLHALKENFGHIGEVFITHVLKNLDAIKARVREVVKEVDGRCSIQSSERFWSATIAVVLVAGEIAYQLGLLPYDVAHIRKWAFEKQVPFMRGIVSEEYSNPIAILAEYLEFINGDILVVNKPQGGNVTFVGRAPRGQLVGRYEIDDKLLWVLKNHFKDYCIKKGANGYRIIEELAQPVIDRNNRSVRIIAQRRAKKVLGAGTDYAKAQSWCFAIDMTHPEVSGVVDLTTVSTPDVKVTAPKRPDLKLVKGENE